MKNTDAQQQSPDEPADSHDLRHITTADGIEVVTDKGSVIMCQIARCTLKDAIINNYITSRDCIIGPKGLPIWDFLRPALPPFRNMSENNEGLVRAPSMRGATTIDGFSVVANKHYTHLIERDRLHRAVESGYITEHEAFNAYIQHTGQAQLRWK